MNWTNTNLKGRLSIVDNLRPDRLILMATPAPIADMWCTDGRKCSRRSLHLCCDEGPTKYGGWPVLNIWKRRHSASEPCRTKLHGYHSGKIGHVALLTTDCFPHSHQDWPIWLFPMFLDDVDFQGAHLSTKHAISSISSMSFTAQTKAEVRTFNEERVRTWEKSHQIEDGYVKCKMSDVVNDMKIICLARLLWKIWGHTEYLKLNPRRYVL